MYFVPKVKQFFRKYRKFFVKNQKPARRRAKKGRLHLAGLENILLKP
jgi:hypothetical protein